MLRATFALVALCLGLSLVAAQPPAPAPAVTMDDIKKAWQERQDKVKTLKLSWKQVMIKPMGSMDNFIRHARDASIKAPQPARDVRLVGEADLILAQDRFRFDSRRETWFMGSQSIQPFRKTALYDGKDYRHQENSYTEPERDQAAVQSTSRSSMELELLELKPIWWCARGAKNLLGQDSLADYEVTGQSIQIRGTRCVMVESKVRSNNVVDRLAIAVGSYLPLQYTHIRNGRSVVQIDVEYDKLIGESLVPSKWRYTTNRTEGRTDESFEATVTACDIGSSVPDSAFQLSSRPGTVVVDTRQNIERIALVLPDGTTSDSVDRRTVTTYEDLVAATKHAQTRWLWLVASLAFVALTSVIYLASRRRHRRNLRSVS